MSKTEQNYSYFSRVLNKPFDTLEELRKAEAEHFNVLKQREALIQEKKARAKEVEDAYTLYLETRKECSKQIAAAESNYLKLRDKFAKDYNGYHFTYRNNNGEETISFDDLLETLTRIF